MAIGKVFILLVGVSLCILNVFGEELILADHTSAIRSESRDIGVNRWIIRPPSSDYCQVYLEFTVFTIEQPISGICSTGIFEAYGQIGDDFSMCGDNVGQHMYLTYDNGADIRIDITTWDASSEWDIQVTQLICGSADIAPTGCLQYYTDVSGLIQSFNYHDYDYANTYQIASQRYQICFDDSGYNTMTIDDGSQDLAFVVTGSLGDLISASSLCTTDYLLISGAVVGGTTVSLNTLCGGKFIRVQTTSKPFRIDVVTDGSEPPTDVFNNGFSLTYSLTA